MALCQLHQEQQEDWLICLSKECSLNDRQCCSGCFLTKHLHNDQIQFKMRKDIHQSIDIFVELADQRTRLEDELDLAYAARQEKLLQMLNQEREAMRKQMQKVFDLQKSKKILKLKEGGYSDVELIYEITQQNNQFRNEDQRNKAKNTYMRIQQQINKWREQPIDKFAMERVTAYRRPAQPVEVLEQDRPRKQNRPNEQRVEQAQSADSVRIATVRQQVQENTLRSENGIKTNKSQRNTPSNARKVKNFQQAEDYVTQIMRDPAKPKELRLSLENEATTNIKNFISFLKNLGGLEIEVLELRICENWTLSSWMLQKLDSHISQIKNLRHVILYCTSDTPRQHEQVFKNIYKHVPIHNIHMTSDSNKK